MTLPEKTKREDEERQRAQLLATAEILRGNDKYGVPAILSFFVPGLGQIVKGEVGKGILAFLGSYIGLIFLIVPGVIVWVWQLVDAYNNKPLNKQSV